MYVCICYGITDSEIVAAIENGADNRTAIAETLGAGTCCGRCCDELDELLIQHQNPVVPVVMFYQPQAV